MIQGVSYWRQESANQTGLVSVDVKRAAVVFSAAGELLSHFRNSFHVPELPSLFPGWAICQEEDDCRAEVTQQINQNCCCYLDIYPADLWCSSGQEGNRTLFLENGTEKVQTCFKFKGICEDFIFWDYATFPSNGLRPNGWNCVSWVV